MVVGKIFNKRRKFIFWGTDNHPKELWNNSDISQKLNDLHHNPVEERLAFRAEQSIYSSAVDDAGGKG